MLMKLIILLLSIFLMYTRKKSKSGTELKVFQIHKFEISNDFNFELLNLDFETGYYDKHLGRHMSLSDTDDTHFKIGLNYSYLNYDKKLKKLDSLIEKTENLLKVSKNGIYLNLIFTSTPI